LTLLERLKSQTRPAHDAIEAALDLERMTASPREYRATLERFYGFHAAFEPEAGALIRDEAFFAPRRKTALLARDLEALGLCRAQVERLPRHGGLGLATRADAYGALYVVEGSTLGGAIVARRVERALGYEAASGAAYFRSYGPGVGPMWKTFQARLASLSSPAFDEAVTAAAIRTFAAMQDWLCEECPA